MTIEYTQQRMNATDPFAPFGSPPLPRPASTPIAGSPPAMTPRLGPGDIPPTTGDPMSATPLTLGAGPTAPTADPTDPRAHGTPANPFAGFVSPDGGSFGSGPPGAQGFESIAGAGNAQKLGDTSQWTPDQWTQATSTFAEIGNRDPAAIAQNTDGQPGFLRDTARSYAMGAGSGGYQGDAAWGDFQARQAAQAKQTAGQPLTEADNAALFGASTWAQLQKEQAAPQAPDALAAPTVPADPFGQFDDPAHPTRGVITPAYLQQLQAQGAGTPLVPVNPAADPNASATTNPFASFATPPVTTAFR